MKTRSLIFAALLIAGSLAADPDAERRANLVILDGTAVKNLGLTTVQAAPADFEETVFSLGRIEILPGHRSVVSSRIPGRAVEVFAKHDHAIRKNDVAVVIESRQFGEPPPRIELRSPINGIISASHVAPGQPVEPTDVLVEILDLSEVYAIARVPDYLAGRLQRGQKARITTAAVHGREFEAVLEHLGATADAASGTVEAAFHVDNPELLLRPGMRAEFAIVVARHTGVTSVPRTAVQGEGANRFVYVKDFELPNAFLKTPVVIGRSNDRAVEIVSGLFPADEVVAHGAYSLAFAGGGSLSLKEALDAAHGHEHAADGSELSADSPASGHGHDHGHDDHGSHERFWMLVSAALFVALVFVSAKLKQATAGRGN
jgi:cobalt-zinc-cadmium efflux system membrane fusion protein